MGDDSLGGGRAPVRILDSTLREGEQFCGLRLNRDEKAHCVRLLEDFGVDFIEIGHPAVSEDDLDACTFVSKARNSAELLAHARASVHEVQVAAASGADWVGIWISANEISTRVKWNGRSLEEILAATAEALAEAKRLGLKIRLTVEDASRTDLSLVHDLARFATDQAVDAFSIADTVGALTPATAGPFVSSVTAATPVPVEVHLHNDLGLAVANALAAVDAGAAIVDTSILGLGERAGIVDLVQLATALALEKGDERWNLESAQEMATTVAHLARFQIEPHRPVVGWNAHAHVAKYHQDAVAREPESYERYDPALVGGRRRMAGERPDVPPARLPDSLRRSQPFPRDASELRYHRSGVGTRWVLIDERVDPAAQVYLMKRTVTAEDTAAEPDGHVDAHVHHCPSCLVFLGSAPDNTGFTCEVAVGDDREMVHSPATIWIPAGVPHWFRIVAGAGEVLNLVLAPEYNGSLIDADPAP